TYPLSVSCRFMKIVGLLHSHALGQVARFVGIQSASQRQVIGQYLRRYGVDDGSRFADVGDGDVLVPDVARKRRDADDVAAASLYFLRPGQDRAEGFV